jgi:prepilin-type N-terminal cleavage/methylation domain-containing protein
MTQRSGFTLIEMLVVMVVAVILISIVVEGMDGFQTKNAVRQARNVFLSMHARTRAQAVEFGQMTELSVDADGDSVWITRNDSTLSVVRFQDELGVDIDGDGVATLCMTPRGFADSSCNSFGEGTMEVRFIQGTRASNVSILPLGQAIY